MTDEVWSAAARRLEIGQNLLRRWREPLAAGSVLGGKRPPSATKRAALTQEVREVHRLSRENYGYARVYRESRWKITTETRRYGEEFRSCDFLRVSAVIFRLDLLF